MFPPAVSLSWMHYSSERPHVGSPTPGLTSPLWQVLDRATQLSIYPGPHLVHWRHACTLRPQKLEGCRLIPLQQPPLLFCPQSSGPAVGL